MFHGYLDYLFENYLLEVRLTHNQETMALRMLTTADLCGSVEDPLI
jgi:hypothetical protein